MKRYAVAGVDIETVHKKLFEIVCEFDRICRKNNIKYSIEGGTMLGAEKYGGFVPWDDDIDVILLREEYDKFLKACQTDLDGRFFLQNSRTDAFFPLNYSKLRLNHSKYVQESYEFLDMHQGIFIDIFPVDGASKKFYKLKRSFIGLLNGAKQIKLGVLANENRKCPKISKVKELLYKIVACIPLRTLNVLLDKTISCKTSGKKYVYEFVNGLKNSVPELAEPYRHYTDLLFEGKPLMVIKDYKNALLNAFGDYQNTEPDVQTRGPSHAIRCCDCGDNLQVGILTFHRAYNYGAVMQAYALNRTIRRIAADENIPVSSEIIDYSNESIENRYRVKKLREIKKITTKIKYCLLRKGLKNDQRNYEQFRKCQLNVGKSDVSHENIHQDRTITERYDTIFVGSDQVWNTMLTSNDDTYFLDFVDKNAKKNAYAASIGWEGLVEENPNVYLQLRSFNSISVRETAAVDALSEIGISSQLVLDPTLIADKAEYDRLTFNKTRRKKEYVLLYSIAYEPALFSFAKAYAKQKNLQLIFINTSQLKRRGMKNLNDVSVPEFLSLIKNAECVITSSYHGLAFSLIYHKEFYYALSESDKNFNSRMHTLLDITGLQNRDFKGFSKEKIDWDCVEQRLSPVRDASKKFIVEVLREAYEEKIKRN